MSFLRAAEWCAPDWGPIGLASLPMISIQKTESYSANWGKCEFCLADISTLAGTRPGQNLDEGVRPIIVTLQKGLLVAEALCENQGIADRVDIFEIEQFMALNLNEFSRFASSGRRVAVKDLIDRYNYLIDEFETDPGMRIDMGG